MHAEMGYRRNQEQQQFYAACFEAVSKWILLTFGFLRARVVSHAGKQTGINTAKQLSAH